MRKKVIFIVTFALIVLIATISIVSANSDNLKISNGFDAIKEKLDQLKKDKTNSSAVAEVDGIAIDKERFTFYKSNVELTYALRGDTNVPNDKALLENLITDELTVQQAIKSEITVSEEEISQEIAYQRSVYENEQPTDKDQEMVLELMKNRIRITGMTDDEFWNSDFVRKEYKKSILMGKHMMELISNGTVKDMNEYQAYKKDLFQKSQQRIKYHEDVLNEKTKFPETADPAH